MANHELPKRYGRAGTRRAPTEPDRCDEEALIEKALDWGPEGFQLQYMLDTSLMDAMRQQLKLSDFIVANFSRDLVPEVLAWRAAAQTLVKLEPGFPLYNAKMYYPEVPKHTDWVELRSEERRVGKEGRGGRAHD